jgi:hypothetical protein
MRGEMGIGVTAGGGRESPFLCMPSPGGLLTATKQIAG